MSAREEVQAWRGLARAWSRGTGFSVVGRDLRDAMQARWESHWCSCHTDAHETDRMTATLRALWLAHEAEEEGA